MKRLRSFLVLVVAIIATSGAMAQSSVPQTEAVDSLIEILEDPALNDQLLERLREVSARDTQDDADHNAPSATDADASDVIPETGLIGAVGNWSSDIIANLPTATFGVPIEVKAQQAWTQVSTRSRSGIESGGLQRFASLALPVLIVVALAGYMLRRFARSLVKPERVPRKRRLVGGLLIKTIAYIALFLAVATTISVVSSTGVGFRVLLTLIAGLLLALLLSDLLTSGLSALAGMRGPRFTRYCQIKFYPWLVSIGIVSIGAALCLDPELRRVIGWSTADLAGFGLNLLAAVTTIAFIFTYRPAISRLIFGTAARRASSPGNPIANAIRQLAGYWHLFAYAFLGLSLVSLVAGQRDNDVVSQVLWSFATVLGALILTTLFRRLFSSRIRRIRRGAVQQALLTAMYNALRHCTDIVVALGTVLMISQIWGFDLWNWLSGDGQQLTRPLFAVLVCAVLAWFIWVALDAWIASALTPTDAFGRPRQSSNRAKTLLPLVRNGVMILLALLTGIAVLANIGVDVTPLIAGAGVFGLALSFGSQQLVQDVITGLFILAEDTIAIGDTIDTGDRSGVVESISLRTIRLRDGEGALHSVPFSTVKAFKNRSRNYGVFRPRYAVPSGVDPEQIIQAMRETTARLRSDPQYTMMLKSDMHEIGIDEIRAGAVVISGSLRTSPMRQTELARAFNGLFMAALAERGIAL